MNLTIGILYDEADVRAFTDYLERVESRAQARGEMIPILLEALEPLVGREKEYLEAGEHVKSRALVESLQARAGSGDKAGTISVFSAATAKRSTINKTWGRSGRRQQREYLAGSRTHGRTAIWYAPMLHQGHPLMVRGPGGQYVQSKNHPMVDPVPFAAQAVEALGDAQQQACADAVLNKIVNG